MTLGYLLFHTDCIFFVTGNTVIDALYYMVQEKFGFADNTLSGSGYANRRVVLVTTHRRENLGEPKRHVYKAMKRLVDEIPDIEIVFSVHKKTENEELGGTARGI